jgi:pimeloyl-ACP methyl ester carboxylesterase
MQVLQPVSRRSRPRRRRRIGLAVLVLLVAALAVNTVVLDNETDSARARDGGGVLRLAGADLNVRVDGDRRDPPVVLLHCFSCSIRWWQPVASDLAKDHRVIRIDLLGHGGSDKPKEGYSMETQAGFVAQALAKLRVHGATVAGHSMGGTVATALAERGRGVVDRVVIVDTPPTHELGQLPFLARVGFWPVIGEAIARVAPDPLVENELAKAFADDVDVPDFAIDDFREMTYSSYDKSPAASDDYGSERSLRDRLAATRLPLLAVFGSEDKLIDADDSLTEYRKVPGARVREIRGAGHSPPLERPREVARLIRAFAR